MKTEEQATPQPTYTQWNSNQIPLDPALQAQSHVQPAHTASTSATTSAVTQTAPTTQATHTTFRAQYQHYPYQHYTQPATYAQFQHQPYVPLQAAQQATLTATIPTAPAKPNTPAPPQTNALDTTDVTKLNDALGSAGVDLRAEEESLHRSFDQYQAYRPYEDRSRKQPPRPQFDTRTLSTRIREIGTQFKVTKVPEESVNYLALALRARLQELVEQMITASQHRVDAQFDKPATMYEDDTTPMWSIVIRADISKQLQAIERVEREEEMKIRRERKERADMAAAHAASLANQSTSAPMAVDVSEAQEDGQPKKKKKKADGPGVTARNMSEDVRKKMSNAVASQAAGLGQKYAWMNAAAAATPAPKVKPAGTPALGSATTTAPAAGSGGSWARPYVSSKTSQPAPDSKSKEEDTRRSITLRDAMFVIEKERGHGGGRGSARGWT